MTPAQFLQQSDPILGAVIAKIGELEIPDAAPEAAANAHFSALCRIVTGQQLSVAVARAIWQRVEAHFAPNLTPDAVLDSSADDLRKLGLSAAKARTLQALATHIQARKLQISELEALSNAEITREIVEVKGLGPWSADMFLMFHIVRPDVLPVTDLGIREAIKRLYGLETRPDAAEMERIAQPWQPHRTLAARYLWKFLDLK